MKKIVQAVLSKFGARLVRVQPGPTDPFPEYTAFFSTIKKLGFSPTHIIDVGANKSIWTRHATRFFPDSSYTLIEPLEHLKVHSQDLIAAGYKIRWINAGAADVPGKMLFTVWPEGDIGNLGTSAAEAAKHGRRQIEIPIVTLNEVLSQNNLPVPELVKIDAEGYDLKVIEGASKLIGKTEIFLIELAVCCRDFENTMARGVEMMAKLGYVPFDITDLNRSPKHGVLWLVEVVFIKQDSPLLKRITSFA